MGETAENLVQDFNITRDKQDQFALTSHLRTVESQQQGFFSDEIAPITFSSQIIKEDVGPRKGQTIDALKKLRPVFKSAGGSVTAGNSSQITDGAVALIVCLADEATKRGWQPLGYLRDYAIAGLDPSRMGLGPVYAIHQLLQQNQKNLADFDRFEINEAFAAQVLACQKAFASPEFCQKNLGLSSPYGQIDPAKLNIHGGAIALGHPVGATGARLILTLLRELKISNNQHGIASLCVGGGQGVALWLSTSAED
jgi:acetyl-CoA C-acetyltransferase/acetyl-CoA acyltransferase